MCPWFSSKISQWVFQHLLFDLVVCKKSVPWFFLLWKHSELDIAENKAGPSHSTSGSQAISPSGAVRCLWEASSLLTVALYLYDWNGFSVCQVYPDFLNTDFSNCSRYFEINYWAFGFEESHTSSRKRNRFFILWLFDCFQCLYPDVYKCLWFWNQLETSVKLHHNWCYPPNVIYNSLLVPITIFLVLSVVQHTAGSCKNG